MTGFDPEEPALLGDGITPPANVVPLSPRRRSEVTLSTPRSGELTTTLDGIEAFIRKYVHFRIRAQAVAVTLWAAHTYAVEQFEQSPLLAITSAVMRSGKTRLLDALELLVCRPWRVVLPSDAVVYRYIEAKQPTLLLDEVDAIFGRRAEQYEGLRALLNAGNRQGTSVPRVVGQGAKMRVQEFSVYCAKALAGIGVVPATIADRAIPIRLERRAQREHVARFRRADADAEAAPLREAIASWMEADFASARPEVPQDLDDRAAEGWEPLLAIADLAGGEWPKRARQAAVELHASREQDEEALSLVLLRDIRDVFAEKAVDRLHTADLLTELHALEASPWGDYFGKPLGAHGVARLVRPYRVEPKLLRIGHDVKRGYEIGQFADAFSRYVPAPVTESAERYTATDPQEMAVNEEVRNEVTVSEGVTQMERAATDLGLAASEELPL